MDLIQRERNRVPRITLSFGGGSRLTAPQPRFTRSVAFELVTLSIVPTLSYDATEILTANGPLSWTTSFSLQFRLSVSLEVDQQFSPRNRSINQPSWVTRISNELMQRGRHVTGHLDGWSRVLSDQERACYAELRQSLPTPDSPCGVRRTALLPFLRSTGEHWTRRVTRALLDESCRWDTQDYPRLQSIIGRTPRLGRPVACQSASRFRVGARPGAPIAVNMRRFGQSR